MLYGLTLPLADRHALHLVFGIMAVLFTLVNANQAGIPGLGRHPRVSGNGRNVGIVFAAVLGGRVRPERAGLRGLLSLTGPPAGSAGGIARNCARNA